MLRKELINKKKGHRMNKNEQKLWFYVLSIVSYCVNCLLPRLRVIPSSFPVNFDTADSTLAQHLSFF